MIPTESTQLVARGPGPPWLRRAFGVLAGLYLVALVKHPPQWRGLRVAGFFTESTCLFPRANVIASDFRLSAWSCSDVRWEPLDPGAYFPIEADDKESRFQRFVYFYQTNRPSMLALATWIEQRHPTTSDGIMGAIGGIRIDRWTRPIPTPGSTIEPYVYRPLERLPPEQLKPLYYTPGPDRRGACAP